MNPKEREQLIDALCDGAISDADLLRLQAELSKDPAARAAYYERMKLHTALELESEGGVTPLPAAPQLPVRTLAILAAAAAILLVGILALSRPPLTPAPPVDVAESARVEPVASGFGVVAEQADAVWSLNRGDLLPQGRLHLESGSAELELFSGVTVQVEAGCEFEVLSAMEVAVHAGRLRANVPRPATGFRVHTATGDIVDLGTEFVVAVTPQHADMHVIGGEIEWHPTSKPMRTLVEGQSLRWNASGEPEDVDFEAAAPVDFAASREARHAAWLTHSRELRNDPRLLIYYAMDQDARQLTDSAGAERHGTIVRAKPTQGRWDQSNALDFSPTGSRVRLNIPGQHRSLTFYCWARIDSLDRWYNSLFLTDGHELHEPHWQIMDDGRLFFSVKARDANKKGRDKYIAYSPPFWTPALSGKWLQIATVYDVDAKTTTHYVNGEQISQDRLPDADVVETVSIGAASIGNWSEPKREAPHFAVRNLNGAIDEFAIFADALSATEIADLYRQGKP